MRLKNDEVPIEPRANARIGEAWRSRKARFGLPDVHIMIFDPVAPAVLPDFRSDYVEGRFALVKQSHVNFSAYKEEPVTLLSIL